MRKSFLLTLLLSLALASPASAHVRLDLGDLTRQTRLPRDGDLILTLPENPTTGYRWTLRWSPERMLELVDDEYLPPPDEAPGAGGTRRFVLRGVKVDSGALILQYGRSWEGGEQDPPLFLPVGVVRTVNYEAPPPVRVTRADLRPLTPLALDNYLLLTLEERPSTGYSWSLRWEPQPNLRLVSTNHYSSGPQPGAPGIVRFTLDPRVLGWCLMTCQYSAPDGATGAPLCALLNVTE